MHGSTNYGTYFPDVTVGTTNIGSFKLLGENTKFHRSIHLYKTGSEMFTINKTLIDGASIDKDLGGHEEEVLITYNPTSEGSHKATILLYSGSVLTYPWYTFGWIILKGSAVERHLTASALQSFRTITVGESDTITIHVEGTNLNGPVTVTLDDHYSNTDMFSINKHSLDPDITGAINDDVKLIYTPTAVGTHGVSVDVSGGGALEVASVVLTGHCEPPTHIITVDHSTLNFGTVVKGETPPSKSFTVTGTNLTNDLILSLSPECSHYTVSPTRITPNEAANGKPVTVTYHPSAAGTHNIDLKIDEEGMLQGGQLVNLSGKCVANPTISVNPEELTFDDVVVGDYKTDHFTVWGDFTSNLELTVTPANGVFSINKDVISPEQAANGQMITVTYRPVAEGTQTATVTISGGGAPGTKTVRLTGNAVVREIDANPAALTFSKITVSKDTTKTIKVTGTNLNGPLTVKLNDNTGMYSLNNNKASITITADEAANGANVIVKYKPTVAGSHVASISIYGGGVLEDKTVSLIGSAVVREITTTASSLNFGKVAKGKSKTKKFTVKGTNLTGPLTLEATGTNKSLFTISPSTITTAQAASGVEVSVTYKPTAKGSHTAKITISGGDALSDKPVDLTGQCVEPKISVSKETLDFGNMDAGTSKTLSFTVTGTDLTGDISLTVASTDSHADFTITPTTLGANASGATVKVTCTANVAGSISGRVTVSGGDATSKTVSLTGTVKCYITTNHNSLSYSPSSLNKSVKITCVGANSKLSMAIIGDDASYFTLGSSSISMADARDGKTVSIACVPKTKTSLSAKIKITGGGADDAKYVTLSYTKGSSGGTTQICSVEPDGDNEGGNNEFINGGSLEVIGASTTDVNELTLSAKVYAEGQTIIIESPVLQTAVISDIAGHAWAVDLQNGRNEIPVNASGIYIVRIREKTTKLMLK